MSANPQINQPLPLPSLCLSEVCPRGWSGSGSPPRGAGPELIACVRERGKRVCNPVGLSAVWPGLSSLIDRMGKLRA